MSQNRIKIKNCLQIITKSIKQLPEDKQPIIASRVNKVLQKYSNQQNIESLERFQKQLQFNMNFIKLSYPNINFNIQQKQKTQPQQPNKQQNKIPNDQNNPSCIEQMLQGQFQLLNSYELKKQMKDISSVRQQVQFSNWSEGNVDPDQLKKHKQLLTRQHFGGDFWEGKEMPKMQTAQILSSAIEQDKIKTPKITQKNLQKKEKKFAQDPSTMFQQLKR